MTKCYDEGIKTLTELEPEREDQDRVMGRDRTGTPL